jgi:hypothetical protein
VLHIFSRVGIIASSHQASHHSSACIILKKEASEVFCLKDKSVATITTWLKKRPPNGIQSHHIDEFSALIILSRREEDYELDIF